MEPKCHCRSQAKSLFVREFMQILWKYSERTQSASGVNNDYGTGEATKTDEFSEKFQMAFDPTPPHFQKIRLQLFSENARKKPF